MQKTNEGIIKSAPQPLKPGSAITSSEKISNEIRNLETKYNIDNYELDQTLYHELGYMPNEAYNTITVHELSLSVRSMNALRRANLSTLHIIMSTRIGDLINIRNLGRISLLEVIHACDQFCKSHPIETLPQDQKTINTGLPKLEQNDIQEGSTLERFILDYCKLNSAGQLVAREIVSTLTKLKQFQKITFEDFLPSSRKPNEDE